MTKYVSETFYPDQQQPEARFDLDTYEAEVIDYDDRLLHERNLQEVLYVVKEMIHRRGEWATDMWSEKAIRDDLCLNEDRVRENIMVMTGMATAIQVLADENRIDYGDVVPPVIIHGFSLYYDSIGCDIEIFFKERITAIKQGQPSNVIGDCKINLDETTGDHTIIYIPKKISGMVGRHSRMGCIPKYKLYLILFCYSLLTHPEYTGYHEICKRNKEKFERQIKERIKLLKLSMKSI